ncbi:hypothetical protein MVES1_003778 [Malassezia vespertilionis]|uniref:uncharacterized protein n=1 Tax=Malassezia vespertilionis TaxID=2020962 RepID=UPI0024B1ED42|nr:uncharacterized protein MVES1_003778 [Malassezia vespertilionis]WFD08406.1 hypothetical protein MVES1_003778 [Malassezia vespertilionis]
MSGTKRLNKELSELVANPPAGIVSIKPDESNFFRWNAVMQGPPSSPYEGGRFHILLEFPLDYPFKGVNVHLENKVYHPNIDDDGALCIDAWKPSTKVYSVLESIYQLLVEPNPDDPLVSAIVADDVATYAIYTSPNHAPVAYHLPTLIVTPYGQPQHILYTYVHTNYNQEASMMGELCVAKMIPPSGTRRLGGPEQPKASPSDRSVFCEASRNLKWTISNAGINAPVYKLMLPNPDMPGNDQPLFQISKPNPNAMWWSMFYFTYGGHLIPPKRIEFGRIQKNAVEGNAGGAGTCVTITGRTPEETAVWQTLGEGNEDMVEWIVLCAALNLIDEEIIKAASRKLTDQPGMQLNETSVAPIAHAQRPPPPAMNGAPRMPESKPTLIQGKPNPIMQPLTNRPPAKPQAKSGGFRLFKKK